MGHVRIGTLPRTRAWRDVVQLIADGADVTAIADATMRAAEKAFSFIQKDPGFKEAVWLMTQLAIAAKMPDPGDHLASVGIHLSKETSLAEVGMAVGIALDHANSGKNHSDFPEIAHNALVGTVSEHIRDKLPTLFSPTSEDVHLALSALGKKKEFGEFGRTFFSKLTNSSMEYFLSKTLATHLGEGQRFVTMNQMCVFEKALNTHCHEASVIVEDFCADWFSKHRFEGGGNITRKEAEGFGWKCIEKMNSEFKERAKQNAK